MDDPQIYDNTGDFFSNGFTENANFSISQRTDRTSYAFGLNKLLTRRAWCATQASTAGAHAARSTGTSTMSGSSDLPPTMCTDPNIRTAPAGQLSGIVNVVHRLRRSMTSRGFPRQCRVPFAADLVSAPPLSTTPTGGPRTMPTHSRHSDFSATPTWRYRPAINWGDNLDLVIMSSSASTPTPRATPTYRRWARSEFLGLYRERELYTPDIQQSLITG